jgi:outer membrane immunogenic protein
MWKKIGLLSGAAIPAAFSPALSADLPVRSPAPAPVFTVSPFSWGGFYVGVNAGLITSSTKLNGFNPGGPDSYCWSDNCNYRASGSKTGGIFGAQIGYNFQSGSMVYGVEADIGFSSATKSYRSTNPNDYTFGKTGVSAIGTARFRLGYAFDRTLLYVTGGLAFGDTPGVGDGYHFAGFNFDRASKAGGGWKLGFAVGAGVEYALNNNWSVKAEGLYYDLGKKSGASVGTFAPPPGAYSYNSGIRTDTTGVIARVGLNYKFGGSGPVMARY